MSLVNAGYLLKDAMQNRYAVPSLNCVNLESVEVVIQCAEEERSGVIIQTHSSFLDPITLDAFGVVTRHLAARASVPVAIGLDHGRNLKEIVGAIRCGFTSIMIDAADQPIEENIRRVKEVVDLCHPQGITVEAALGNMPLGGVQTAADLATVADAVRLVKETGVDAFAPAVGNIHGTAHGEEKSVPTLNTRLIGELFRATQRPLALHGGSSTPAPQIDAAVENGIRWFVVFSDLAKAFTRGLQEVMAAGLKTSNPVEYLRPAAVSLKEVARSKMRVCHSNGRFVR